MLRLLLAIFCLASHVPTSKITTYAKIIHTESKRKGIDPLLVVAEIHRETGGTWNPKAYSKRNYGLMQVRVSHTTNTAFIGREEELLPVDMNIKAGVRMLRHWRWYHHTICRSSKHPWWSHYQWGAIVGNSGSGERVRLVYDLIKKRTEELGHMFDATGIFDENIRLSKVVLEHLKAWTQKYQDKNDNYGNSWLLTGETLSMWFPHGLHIKTTRQFIIMGLLTRILDKVIRTAHLELGDRADKVGETSSDTMFDLGIYGFLAGTACSISSRKSTTQSKDG